MFDRLKIAVIILFVLPAVSSCRAISSFLTDSEVVAQVGTDKLYRSDLDKIIPKGMMPEDSVRMARQYINTWASDQIFLKVAMEQLSKAERDVTLELEDYRKSLLKYRYEQLYVNERLDTSVTMENIEQYYESHKDKFILDRPIVKARFLNIAEDSPVLPQIRKRMSSSEAGDLVEADSLAFSSAVKFTTWADRWIDVNVLAGEYMTGYESLLASVSRGWIEKVDTLGQKRLTYISDMINKGQPAPVEFCEQKIRDIIISSRKQELVQNLERDLLNDACENGQFKVY
jgi:hypothetical protein